ncbi:MAG: phosphate signaling complex protein PhoU [Rickettsiales bacterium]
MTNHIVNSYDTELNELRHSVVKMANLVKELISIATTAIKNQDQSFVELANTTDKKINHYDDEIEKLAIHVIALRQPMAIDLRQVIAALKLAVILERMGDLSKKISYRFEYLPISLDPALSELIINMVVTIENLLDSVITAYDKLDDNLATKVSKQDHLIDQYYTDIMALLEAEMQKNSHNSKHLLKIVLAIRNLERIGDYITKISYVIHYIITGDKKIYHSKN